MLYFLWFFKWGEKRSDCHDIYEFTRYSSFVVTRYLWVQHDAIFLLRHDIFDFISFAHRSARHDIFDSNTTSIFWSATIFMIAPRCHLLLHHDIYDCTAMPIFLKHHDILLFPRTPFEFKVTPRCLAPPFPARSLKIMRRWRRQDQRDVKIELNIYHAFMLDFKYTFNFFPTLFFALSRFVFHPPFNLCHSAFLFIARASFF